MDVSKRLSNYGSIDTIKEDDLLKEEEETTRIKDTPLIKGEKGIVMSSEQIMLKEEDYMASSPREDSISNSPLKLNSKIEYNDDTIRKQEELDSILQTAKRQYKNDRERQKVKKGNNLASSSMDYIDPRGSGAAIAGRLNNIPTKRNKDKNSIGKVKTEDYRQGGGLNHDFMQARTSPPSI